MGSQEDPPPTIPTGPIDQVSSRYLTPEERQAMLDQAIAGIPLGARDRELLDWLISWDTDTAIVVASLVQRARAAGRDQPT